MPTKIYSRVKNVIREGGLRLLVRKVRQRIWVTNSDFFAHQMPNGLPSVRMKMKKCEVKEKDVLIAERILNSFRKASEDEKNRVPKKSYVDAWDDNKGKIRMIYLKRCLPATCAASRIISLICTYIKQLSECPETQKITDGWFPAKASETEEAPS